MALPIHSADFFDTGYCQWFSSALLSQLLWDYTSFQWGTCLPFLAVIHNSWVTPSWSCHPHVWHNATSHPYNRDGEFEMEFITMGPRRFQCHQTTNIFKHLRSFCTYKQSPFCLLEFPYFSAEIYSHSNFPQRKFTSKMFEICGKPHLGFV